MSSVTALPLDARQSSPLGQGALSSNEVGRTATPSRPPLRPIKSALQPSEAELSGRINHDPTVNMSLDIPPSPLTPTRPQIPTSNGGSRANPSSSSGTPSSAGSRSPSPSYPFPGANNKLNPTPTPHNRQDPPSEIRGSARPVSTAAAHAQPVHSQSASIVSKSSDSSNHDEPRSPNQHSEFPTRPARTIHPERSTSYGSYHPPRTSSIPRAASPSAVHQHHDDLGKNLTLGPHGRRLTYGQVSIPRALRIGPPAGNWGNDISHEPDQSIHDSKSIAAPVTHQVYSNHASKLSDSSSIYSFSNAGQRYSTKKLSIDSKSHSQTTSTLPSSTPSETDAQHSYTATLPEGTRRGSDASSHQHALSNPSTSDGSHRHTKELGDFYDSYWRQSNTGPPHSRAGEMYKPHPSGFSSSRGVGDMGKENRRPGQMDFKVATIAEISTPLSSPMPGTAL